MTAGSRRALGWSRSYWSQIREDRAQLGGGVGGHGEDPAEHRVVWWVAIVYLAAAITNWSRQSGQLMPGPEADLEPPVGEDIGGRDLPREQCGVPERDVEHQRPEPYPAGGLRGGHDHLERRVASEVIGGEQCVVPKRLDPLSKADELCPRREPEDVGGEPESTGIGHGTDVTAVRPPSPARAAEGRSAEHDAPVPTACPGPAEGCMSEVPPETDTTWPYPARIYDWATGARVTSRPTGRSASKPWPRSPEGAAGRERRPQPR